MNVGVAIKEYINYRCNLGEKFETASFILYAFGKYVSFDTDLRSITSEVSKNYLRSKSIKDGKVTHYWFCINSVLSGFSQWALKRDLIDNTIAVSIKPNMPEPFKPYIYSDDELTRIFNESTKYRKRFHKIYPEVIQIMLKITYGLGLRPSETVNLSVADIDLNNRLVFIRETKFYKSRITPMSDAVWNILNQFLVWRIDNVRKDTITDNHLFLDNTGSPMKLSALQAAFRLICNRANIHRSDTTRSDVRLQDLRHTFATNRVAQWYSEGEDVLKLLPVLSTYLGHCHLDSTAVYITLTDHILLHASDKFKSYLEL